MAPVRERTLGTIDDPEAREAAVRRVLAALPEWFGDPAALERYANGARTLTTLAAFDGGEAVAVLALERHFVETVEVRVLGVRRALHRRGLGRWLIEAAARTAQAGGARVLTVKTLGPSKGDPHYARTLAFYRAVGFVPLEEFPTLWREPPNPCLFLAKPLP